MSAGVWAGLLGLGVAAVVGGAAAGQPEITLALAALTGFAFAVVAIWRRQRLVTAGAREPALASSTAGAMGVVWGWAAVSMLVTYLFVLSWHEWWQYVLGAGAVAALCFGFAAMMQRDAEAGREDATLLRLARYLTLGQLGGMIIAMLGLIIDDKMPRDPQEPDWAANTIFFFGAAALAAISANALRSHATTK
jgi:hypothetical protein